MGKKKRYRGHYCWMCRSILPNQSFSGKGHRNHICKKCQKLPVAQRQAQRDQDFLFNLMDQKNISGGNRKTLEEMIVRSDGVVQKQAEAILKMARLLPRRKKRMGRLRHQHRDLFDELVELELLYDWVEPEEDSDPVF